MSGISLFCRVDFDLFWVQLGTGRVDLDLILFPLGFGRMAPGRVAPGGVAPGSGIFGRMSLSRVIPGRVIPPLVLNPRKGPQEGCFVFPGLTCMDFDHLLLASFFRTLLWSFSKGSWVPFWAKNIGF